MYPLFLFQGSCFDSGKHSEDPEGSVGSGERGTRWRLNKTNLVPATWALSCAEWDEGR